MQRFVFLPGFVGCCCFLFVGGLLLLFVHSFLIKMSSIQKLPYLSAAVILLSKKQGVFAKS